MAYLVPLEFYALLLIFNLIFILLTVTPEYLKDIPRMLFSFLSVWFSYMNGQLIVSGNVVQTIAAISSTDTIIKDTQVIEFPPLSYFLTFIAIIFSMITLYFISEYVKSIALNKKSVYEYELE